MLHTLYGWYGKRTVQTVMAVIAALTLITLYLTFFSSEAPSVEVAAKKDVVTVKSVKNINFENSFSSVGVVEAISEAKLQAEAGGRITSVTTEVGKSVRAGAILATIENAAQRASVLQAQGAYEAALAGSASGEVGVAGAELNLQTALKSGLTTYQSTYISLDSVLHGTLDDYFTTANGVATGFKLNGQGKAPVFIAERTALETLISNWSQKKATISVNSIEGELIEAHKTAVEITRFTESLSSLVQNQEADQSFTQVEKDAVTTNLNTARVAANAAVVQIEGAQSQIDSAQKGLEQAKLAGAQGLPSASSAQVKIALGSLRAAQAQYEKTLIRTPISGVVNALYVKAGEYVSPSQPTAVIANNAGLQVTTSVSEEDSSLLSVGDTVSIDGLKTGTITALGGAIDPATGKVTVKISVDDVSEISNGSTVTIAFTQSEEVVSDTITVPLSAIKMTGSGPVAFEVVDGKLKSIPLTLGEISGDSVVVETGLTLESLIVVDARGLKEGTEVAVKNN